MLLRLTYFWRLKGCQSSAGDKGQFQQWFVLARVRDVGITDADVTALPPSPPHLQTHSPQFPVEPAHHPHCMAPPYLLLSCPQELLLIQTFGLTQCTSVACVGKRSEMPHSHMQFLPVSSSEHDPDTIKGRSEEDNCCNTDDVQGGRQYVSASLPFADVKHMPPWAVLTGSGREPVHSHLTQ